MYLGSTQNRTSSEEMQASLLEPKHKHCSEPPDFKKRCHLNENSYTLSPHASQPELAEEEASWREM